MSLISQYESLKKNGSSVDRIKFISSLKDKNEIEQYLKESSKTSYNDLQALIFLSNSIKNDKNLLEIFQTESLPIKQRIFAGKSWIKLQKDSKQIENFLVDTINNPNVPRYLKTKILRCLHQIDLLKKSPSFFYDLACRLTTTNNCEEYNIDAHLVPFCTKEQILDLLSRWSIKSLKQIDSTSAFYFKLIKLQPSIILHLIKEDLNQIKTNYEKFSNYFQEKSEIIKSIVKKQPKELICLFIEYLNQLEKHKRYLPSIVQSEQKYLFTKVPNEMINLIGIVASNKPGSIKYKTRWGSETKLQSLTFPRSFSIENYLKLFFNLYETLNWSSNHFLSLLLLMLDEETSNNNNLSSIKKRRKWFFDIIVQQKIGQDIFLQKLLKEGNEDTLEILKDFPELTNSLSIHLLSKYERNGIVKPEQRLSLIRYQLMNKELFDLFLSLFKQTGSNVNQRQENYPLFLKSALSTNEEFTQNVLQWIEKRFTNEQLIVIERFISSISSLNDQFYLQILPKNFKSIENIFNIAINHLQRSTHTLTLIINYGTNLLKLTERYSNQPAKNDLQQFAIQIIKQCFAKPDNAPDYISSPDKSYPLTRKLILNILLSDVFPRLISKSMLSDLNTNLSQYNDDKRKCLPEIDSFLNKFFTETLPSSKKLRSTFSIEGYSTIIQLFLKNKSTRLERVNFLINQLDKIFFIDQNIQRFILRSQQYRSFIDQLVQDNKMVTFDKISNEESPFFSANSQAAKIKLPGYSIDLLNSYSQYLTGQQQEHITNIILDEYLQNEEITNLNKLKSLRVLRRLTDTYNKTLEWIKKKEDSPLATKNPNEISRRNRGAAAQPLDDIILCLPSTFDLSPSILIKQFPLLTTKLNASNAKFVSDAILNISKKIPDEIFLKDYFQFIQNEQFQKAGITANKEILRLLIEFTSDSSVISKYLKPFWDTHPHQDIRACLILILLHFIGKKTNSNQDEIILWKILEEAANDEYILVIQHLLGSSPGRSPRILNKLKTSSKSTFEKFVNEIQFKILDPPNELQARSLAWNYIDYEHVDTNKLIEKAQELCIQFDKDANTLWRIAFEKLISLFKEQRVSSIDIIINIIKKMMSRREEIDSEQNGIDNKHDLPVFHRIQNLLTILNSNIDQFTNENKIQFRSLTQIIFQFDKILSPQIGTLLIKISQNKEDLENILKFFQDNLPETYFQTILTHLATLITKKDSCPFVQQLTLDEKLQLAQWFIKEKDRPSFVFDLLKNDIFNQTGVDLKTCQDLIRQFRSNEDLFLRQEAMEYTVPWDEHGNTNEDDNDRQMSVDDDSDDSDMD